MVYYSFFLFILSIDYFNGYNKKIYNFLLFDYKLILFSKDALNWIHSYPEF